MTKDARLYAPAAARNKGAIQAVLRDHLPKRGLVLEIASGTGEHVAHIAASSGPGLIFQPSDPDPHACESIDCWAGALGLTNVRPAIAIDAVSLDWPVATADAVLCINMIHIAPWVATNGLLRGAARLLPAGGLFYLYGPFRRDGRHTASSNADFDAGLRMQDCEWGVRDLEAVVEVAAANGFAPPQIEQMPANNLSLIFRK